MAYDYQKGPENLNAEEIAANARAQAAAEQLAKLVGNSYEALYSPPDLVAPGDDVVNVYVNREFRFTPDPGRKLAGLKVLFRPGATKVPAWFITHWYCKAQLKEGRLTILSLAPPIPAKQETRKPLRRPRVRMASAGPDMEE